VLVLGLVAAAIGAETADACIVDADCNDGVSCTVDTCAVPDGTPDPTGCAQTPDDGLCGDGLFCNGAETCDAVLDCQVGTAPAVDDGVSCTVDSCDEVADVVVHAPTHALCGDGLFCNGGEVCDAVLDCQAGPALVLDDGVSCTMDACDEATDQIVHSPNDGLCSDGLFCTGIEFCSGTLGCLAGPPLVLDDGVSCTVDTCDEVVDAIVHTTDDGLCTDGLFCNGAETCDAVLDCQVGTAPTVDDGVSCTVDSCDEVADVVVHATDDAACADGFFCNGSEICDETLGCQAGAPPVIDDGVVCTIDSCDEGFDVVIHAPSSALCGDGLFCNGGEICNATLGCQAGPPPVIDDGVACTIDSCDELVDQVVHAANDGLCSDGLFCDGIEFCSSTLGCQAGPAPLVDDGVACTLDTCDEASDVVAHLPNDALCNDAQFCNGVETCSVTLGCQNGPAQPDTTPCDDGLFCTISDACEAGACVAGGPRNCSFGVPECNTANCDEGADVCAFTPLPDGTLCDAGACTSPDTCSSGSCVAGPVRDCNDLSVCTADLCVEEIGCTNSPINCNDGDACTLDLCDPVQGCRNIADTQDTDADGRPNTCDVCPRDALDDADGDGLCADVDNCPAVANAGQQNVDNDASGDPCDADSVWVDAASTCSSGCGSSGSPWQTIQAALAGTTGRRAIVVRPGTYAENVELGNRRLNLVSAGGAAVTTIQGGGVAATVTLAASSSNLRTLSGFTITNLGAGPGVAATGRLDVADNVITGAFSPQDGGGIRVVSGTGDLHDNRILGNRTSGVGGGIYVESSVVDVIRNVIQDNVAANGGGVFVRSAVSSIEENAIEGNTSGRDGGGVMLDAAAGPIRDNRIAGNSANPAALGRGGAVFVTNAAAQIEANLIEGNTAHAGGGVHLSNAAADVKRNRLEGNVATSGNGGAVAIADLSVNAVGTSVVNNFVIGNAAGSSGGGVWCDASLGAIDVAHNTLVANAAQASGGGVHLGACNGSLSNNAVVSSLSGQGVFCTTEAVFTIDGNDIWSNAGGEWTGCLPTLTDVSVDPGFAPPACSAPDYHIAPGSAVRDVGVNGVASQPAIDIDGGMRIVDGDGDGTAVADVGADEWSCEDLDGDGFDSCTLPPDCDDRDASVNPHATEVCDGIDNDCDCLVDEDTGVDADGDGVSVCAGDCDDADPAVGPAQAELCNGVDDDCDASVDEGFADQCVPNAVATFSLGDAFGDAGTSVGVTAAISLIDPLAEVAALSADLSFGTGLTSSTPSCTINPAIGPASALGKDLSQSLVAPGVVRVVVVGIGNAFAIPAGDVFSCQLPIAGAAPAGSYALPVAVEATSPLAAAVAIDGRAGSLTVTGSGASGGVTGDCNGDGGVNLGEVQTVINVYSGAQPLAACPAADANGDGVVGIVEVQIAVNAHLGQ
jgi:hypothetical protein